MNGVSSARAGPSKTSMTKSPASVTSVGKSRGVPPANEPRTYSYMYSIAVLVSTRPLNTCSTERPAVRVTIDIGIV